MLLSSYPALDSSLTRRHFPHYCSSHSHSHSISRPPSHASPLFSSPSPLSTPSSFSPFFFFPPPPPLPPFPNSPSPPPPLPPIPPPPTPAAISAKLENLALLTSSSPLP